MRLTRLKVSLHRTGMSQARVSPRILRFVEALPLRDGLRVLEIGCGPGVAAREVAHRVGHGFVLAIDRSERMIEIAKRGSAEELAAGSLGFRCVAAEDFKLSEGEAPFDLAFAMRVGAFDGRHPNAGEKSMQRLRSVLALDARFFIDTGDPLIEVRL